MSSTNKTTNYELSQFVGSDKPAWLADYNQDMSKIDTQMKANADGVTAANGKADTNTSNIGDLTYLSTTAKNTIVGAINEVDSNTDTAQNTANSAASVASSATSSINSLASYLNLTVFNQITNPSSNMGTFTSHNIYVARNSEGTVAKIYGHVGITGMTAGGGNKCIVTLPNTGLSTTSDITIQGIGLFQADDNAMLYNVTTTIKTNGNVEISFSKGNGTAGTLRMIACLLFIKDFGDLPEA